MKVNVKGNKEKYLKENLPTLEEKVDALLEGGQKLTSIKESISKIKEKIK